MFVKYNGVLRGLQSESPFLRKAMLQLCCLAEVFEKYSGGKLTIEEAKRQLNKYTTTLHGGVAHKHERIEPTHTSHVVGLTCS